MLGTNTIDKPKVTSITPCSITVTLKDKEYYLPHVTHGLNIAV